MKTLTIIALLCSTICYGQKFNSPSGIFDMPHILSERLALSKINEPAKVIGECQEFYLVEYNDITGYTRKLNFDKEFKGAKIPCDSDEIYASVRKYIAETTEPMKGTYWRGMTQDEAIISMGNPIDINSTVGSWGYHEQWIYPGGVYLYFENGTLASFQY